MRVCKKLDLTLIYTFGMKQVKDGLQGIAIEKIPSHFT